MRALYYYVSRWYDPVVGRFIQADTIVPNPGNPQALNRYSYVVNNPLRYIDPTGHEGSDFDWITLFNWIVQYYRSHGYEENEAGKWIYTGNFDIPDKDKVRRDHDTRRKRIKDFANDLYYNGTPAGEALARIAEYTAAYYAGTATGACAASFVDDIGLVLNNMAGLNVLWDYYVDKDWKKKGPYYVGMNKYPDSDLLAKYQDGSANQPFHFWFWVSVAYWNGTELATYGNWRHEYSKTQSDPAGQSYEDYLLGQAGMTLAESLRCGMAVSAVSSWIRNNLMQ